MQTPVAMHRAALYKGVNLSPLLSSSFPTSLLLAFAPQQPCPGPFHTATLTVNTRTDQKTKEYTQIIPEEKKKHKPLFHISFSVQHIVLLFLWWASLFQIGFLLSSKFCFKIQGPTAARLTLTPLPCLSSLQPLIFGAESKQLVRWHYG